MAVDRFHKDKKARSALRRARAHDGDRVRLERNRDGAEVLEPVDAHIDRLLAEFNPEQHEIEDVSAPISQTYIHPDPDRRALVDQWLEDRQRPHAT